MFNKKTKKKMRINKAKSLKKQKTSKVFGADRIINFNIHKTTIISINPKKSAEAIIKLFPKSQISDIIYPKDDDLKKRGTVWLRFKTEGKGEIHFSNPYHQRFYDCIKNMIKHQKIQPLLSYIGIDNHVGIYVPDLSDVIIKSFKNKLKGVYVKREDGMNQWFLSIPDALDIICFDSPYLNEKKIIKNFPKKWKNLKISNTFKKWTRIQKKYVIPYE